MTPYPRNRLVEIFWNFSLFICLLSVLVPLQPLMPDEGLEQSWPTVINQALAQGLVFGKDVIFPFGPLASLYTWMFHPFTDSIMVGLTFLWAICFWWVLSSLLSNSSAKQRILWLIFILGFLGLGESRFSLSPMRFDAVFFSYPLFLFVYLLSSSFDLSKRKREKCSDWMILFLSVPIGFLPLIKFSNFFICATLTLLTSMALIFGGRPRSALIFLIAPVLSLLLVVWSLGQPLNVLGDFFKTGLSLSSSYTASMSLAEGPRTYPAIFLCVSGLLLVVLFTEAQWNFRGKIFLLGTFLAYLFMSFKTGLTRADSIHIPIAGQALLIAGMCGALISQSKRIVDVAFLTFLSGLILVGEYYSINLFKNARSNLAALKNGIKTRMFDSKSFETEYKNILSKIQKKNKLPKLSGSTDIFSTGQLFLIASENEWAPRPIPQSHQTLNPLLSELNKAYLLSPQAPQNIFFKTEPIDQRSASMEDSASWPILLSRYEEAGIESGYLKLTKKEKTENQPEAILLKASQAEFNQLIRVPQISKPVFARVFVDLNFRGKIQNVVYKPEELFLQVNLKKGEQKRFRLPPEMAREGFLISPLVESTENFKTLFSQEPPSEEWIVDSFQVLSSGPGTSWNKNIRVELYHYRGMY